MHNSKRTSNPKRSFRLWHMDASTGTSKNARVRQTYSRQTSCGYKVSSAQRDRERERESRRQGEIERARLAEERRERGSIALMIRLAPR